MKVDIFGDDLESFPLENIKGIKLAIACIHIRLPQVTLPSLSNKKYSSPLLDNQIIPMKQHLPHSLATH